MFNLVIILLSTLNGEPKGSNNYKIAKFMIENIHDLEDYTLTELNLQRRVMCLILVFLDSAGILV